MLLTASLFMLTVVFTSTASADWKKRSRGSGGMDVMVTWTGSESYKAYPRGSAWEDNETLSLNTEKGIELMAARHLKQKIFLGIYYSHRQQANETVDLPGDIWYDQIISTGSSFGATAYVASTPTNHNSLPGYCRVRLGAKVDFIGRQISVADSESNRKDDIGRSWQHAIFFGFDWIFNQPGSDGGGAFLLQLMYSWRIESFAPSGNYDNFTWRNNNTSKISAGVGMTFNL